MMFPCAGLGVLSPTVQSVAERLGAQVVLHPTDWLGPFPRPEEYDLVLADGTRIPAFSIEYAVAHAESPSAVAGALQSLIRTAEYEQSGGGPQVASERTYAVAPELFGSGVLVPGRITPITQPNQTQLPRDTSVSAPVTQQPSITQAPAARPLAVAPGISDWIKANQTLLIAGGAGLLVLLLFMGRR